MKYQYHGVKFGGPSLAYAVTGKVLIPIYIPLNSSIELSFKRFLRSLLIGFDIEKIEIISSSRRFTEISIIGKDAEPAFNLLVKYFGGEITWEEIKFNEEIPGRVLRIEEGKILVDIGLKEDDYFKIAISSQEIASKIYKVNKDLSSETIRAMGIDRYLPFTVIIRENSKIDHDRREIEGNIGKSTLKLLSKWLKSRFDRLVVYGATRSSVLKAIKTTRHLRDILNIERAGFLENVIVCKWGTSAVGLIPEIGDYLPKAKFIAIKPRFLKKQITNLYNVR